MSAVGTALISKLISTPAVVAAAPGGVLNSISPDRPPRTFILVRLQAHEDLYQTSSGHQEIYHFLVQAVSVGTSVLPVTTARQAVHAALQDADFPIPGYTLMKCHREELIDPFPEVDGSEIIQNAGEIYEVWVSS